MDKMDSQVIHGKTRGQKLLLLVLVCLLVDEFLIMNIICSSKNAILFIGYQAAGSLGRMIQQGEKHITIDGKKVPV